VIVENELREIMCGRKISLNSKNGYNFFFLTCPHKRERGIRTSDLRFIRRGLSRLSYLLETIFLFLFMVNKKNIFGLTQFSIELNTELMKVINVDVKKFKLFNLKTMINKFHI
jgi:hypothetical protein